MACVLSFGNYSVKFGETICGQWLLGQDGGAECFICLMQGDGRMRSLKPMGFLWRERRTAIRLPEP